MLLPQLPQCTACELHSNGCKSVGLPILELPGGPATILFLGHQPGRDEDARAKVFCGPSGQILRKVYIDALNLQSAATIFLGNLVRCWPMADKPRPLHIRTCHQHLAADLGVLSTRPAPRILVLLGGEAAGGLLGLKLSAALRRNGEEWHFPWLPAPWFVVSTFHPAFLLSKRNPNAVHAAADHMQIVLDRLQNVAVARTTPLIVPPRTFHQWKETVNPDPLHRR